MEVTLDRSLPLQVFLVLADALWLTLVGLALAFIFPTLHATALNHPSFIIGNVFIPFCLILSGAYATVFSTTEKTTLSHFSKGFLMGICAFGTGLFLKGNVTDAIRSGFILWSLSGWVILSCLHAFVYPRIPALPFFRDRCTLRVAIYGAGSEGLKVAKALVSNPDHRIQVVGIYDDRLDPERLGTFTHATSGDFKDLVALARNDGMDAIYIALPSNVMATPRLEQIAEHLRILPVDLSLYLHQPLPGLKEAEFRVLDGLELLSISRRPLSAWQAVMKRVLDLVIVFSIIPVLIPLMGLIALLIKMDSRGPVLFKQFRRGFNCKVFTIYKFRTMKWKKEEHMVQARPGDPRITRVGRFLRRSSLDELPQIFNVLKGELSIVGPRPHEVEMDDEYAAVFGEYLARMRVKPGITGLAQIMGTRGPTETPEKMKRRLLYDLQYAEHPSILGDIIIILKTFRVVIGGKNAI